MIRVFASAMILSMFSISAGAAVNSYHLNVRVERDNLITVDNQNDIDEGIDADLQLRNDDRITFTRVTVRVERVDAQSDDAAVHLQYFEKRGSAWVLVGEPMLVVTPGVEGLTTFTDTKSTRSRYRIAVQVHPRPL